MVEPARDRAGASDDMDRAFAAVDWASTPVGPTSTWPLGLRTVVGLMRTSRFPMWAGWGPELTFFYNDAYRRDTLGMKHPWALGRPASEVWAEIWPDVEPRVRAVMEHGVATWDEDLLLFLERSGFPEETYHTFSYSPITDEGGERVEGLLCVVTEQTERVIGERRMATLRDLAADLAEQHDEQDVLDAVRRGLAADPEDLPFALIYLDEGSSSRLVRTSGIDAGHAAAPEVIDHDGRPWPIGRVLGTGTAEVLDDLGALADTLPGGAWPVPPSRVAVVPIAQRGHPRPVGALVVGLNPFRPVAPRLMSFLELLADQIAAGLAGARTYAAERERAESLAELDRAKSEFFSNVSHELRTPLTLIGGPLEDSLADVERPLDEQHRERLELVRRNVGRLKRLVNNLLDVARVEDGRAQPELVPTDLSAHTTELAEAFAPAVARAGLSYRVECEPLGRPVMVDREMWEKVVLNLLSNAVKYTDHGEVHVSLTGTAEGVLLQVRDTGVGVAAEQQPLLFDRFHRVRGVDARSHEGSGIGLALVRELVELHGGTVGVRSTVGEGSCFSVELPYGDAIDPSSTAVQDPSIGDAVQTSIEEVLQWSDPDEPFRDDDAVRELDRLRSGTVLVVDDNPDLRRYVAGLLRPFWSVREARDGQHALELVAGSVPDLVLSDVMMPRVDGLELLARLRSDPSTATVPVVLLSARAGEQSTLVGLDAGADDYLVKPFSSAELLARVRSALLLSRLRNREATWRAALVQSLDEGIMIADHHGTITECNPAAQKILGLDPSRLPLHPPYGFWPDPDEHPEALATVRASFADALAAGTWSGRLQLRHAEGRLVPVEVTVGSIFDRGERMFVTTLRDLTDALRVAERQEALTRFAAQLSEASTVEQVLDVGLVELCGAFEAEQAVVVRWDGSDEPTATTHPEPVEWRRLHDVVRQALTDVVHNEQGFIELDVPGAPRGLVVSASNGGRRAAMWIELSGQHRVSTQERALAPVLGAHLGQALGRAQLFEDQRTIATAMQRSILGPVDELPGVAVRYAPAELPLQVGGDWYDVIDLGHGRIGLVVGDCVGHGLDAATVMGQLRSACRALLVDHREPGPVLEALDSFASRIAGASCTTAICAVIDGDHMRFASAGHLPPVLVDEQGVRPVFDGRSVPLASLPVDARPETSVQLGEGSTVLLYTDGLIERRGESIDDGLDRLGASLALHRQLDAETLLDRVQQDLSKGTRQDDDIAMVVYRHGSSRQR